MTTLINLFEYILLSAVIVMVFVGLTVGGSRQRVRRDTTPFERWLRKDGTYGGLSERERRLAGLYDDDGYDDGYNDH